MPTGYTAGVQDGTITELSEYAMACARMFGACITMRDDPPGSEIPEFYPYPWHDEKLRESQKQLAELQGLSRDECANRSRQEYEQEKLRRERELAVADQHRRRYEAMLSKVRAFAAPSDDHKELAEFMEKQLIDSIDFDCSSVGKYWEPLEQMDADAWKAKQIESLQRNIKYRKRNRDEEIERVRERNQWVQMLRAAIAKATPDKESEDA